MNKQLMVTAVSFLAMAWAGCTSEPGPSTGGLGTEPGTEPCMEQCADYGGGEVVCPCDAAPDAGAPLDAGDPYQ